MKNAVEKILKDKLAKKILTFFYQNQTSIDSIGGVSAWVHSDRETVRSWIEKLVKLRVLEKDSTGSIEGYCYTRDKKVMKTIEGLLKNV